MARSGEKRCKNVNCEDDAFFHGYCLLAIDGTAVNLPRNPKAPSFVCNDGIPNGVNQLHLTPLYDILSRTFTDAVIQPEPKKDGIGALIARLKRNAFDEKTLIIADRGFESYNLIAHLLETPNVDFLIRVKQSRSAMREVAKLPMLELDCNISFFICTTQKNTDKQNKNYVFLQSLKSQSRVRASGTHAGISAITTPCGFGFAASNWTMESLRLLQRHCRALLRWRT